MTGDCLACLACLAWLACPRDPPEIGFRKASVDPLEKHLNRLEITILGPDAGEGTSDPFVFKTPGWATMREAFCTPGRAVPRQTWQVLLAEVGMVLPAEVGLVLLLQSIGND